MTPLPKPLLLFDGDCGFCRQWVERWRRTTGETVDYAPYQEEAARFPERVRARFAQAVQFLESDGRWSEGAEAVFRSLSYAKGRGAPLWLYRHLPGFAAASEWCYAIVAGRRPLFTRLTRWGWGDHVVPPGETLTAWLFLHGVPRLPVVPVGLAPARVRVPRRLPGSVARVVPPPARPAAVHRAAGAIAALQALIFVTGNCSFFNLLTIALCLLVLDDGVWPASWWPRPGSVAGTPSRSKLGWGLAAALVLTSLVPTLEALRWPTAWLGPFETLYRFASPFRAVDRYGLFAVMTTERPESVLEGSDDGRLWRTYEFRWKPGDPQRRPTFVAPHQPRLDWQMWFAALSDFRREPWFLSFCQRLLEGSKPVTALLARDPFPGSPPRFLRAVVYDYHFTDASTRRRTGAWWRREPKGLYCPVLALEGGRLVAVEPVPAGPQAGADRSSARA